jgi:hypothetical protein
MNSFDQEPGHGPGATPQGPSWRYPHPRDSDPDFRRGFNVWDERVRMRQNIAAAIAVIILGVATYIVFDNLSASSRIMKCIEAGHRNCVPLDIKRPGER